MLAVLSSEQLRNKIKRMINIFSKMIHRLTCLNFIAASFLIFPITNDSYKLDRSFISAPEKSINKSFSLESNAIISVEPFNCPIWGYCYESPILHFFIKDLPENPADYALRIEINGQVYYFENTDVEFQLPFTFSNGFLIKYWFENLQGSIFASDQFYYRLITINPETELYRIELLGHQWQEFVPTYAFAWNIFPPTDGSDYGWAEQYDSASDLMTSNNYALLSGRLIWNGKVEADNCPNGGLELNGAANICGIEATREEVINWQNTHNSEMQIAGQDAFIPPKLIKGIIAFESQFWPSWEIEGEYGLGMITEDGVDMLLMWNQPYFFQKCTLLYSNGSCEKGFLGLSDEQISHLVGYVLQDIGTELEYLLIAEILNAASIQTSKVIHNYTGMTPSAVADFETLWHITLGIYNAGCGCMGNAIEESWKESNKSLTWSKISSNLNGDCASARDYLDKVIQFSQ